MKPTDRCGFSYIAVLGTSLNVGTMALGGLSILRTQSRASIDAFSASKARQDAHAAAEVGRVLLSSDPDWRTRHGSGQLLTSRSTGSGVISATVEDPVDNNLGDNPHDPIRFHLTANQGRAVQRFQVDLTAISSPLVICKSLWERNRLEFLA